jgi:hypothetical protein
MSTSEDFSYFIWDDIESHNLSVSFKISTSNTNYLSISSPTGETDQSGENGDNVLPRNFKALLYFTGLSNMGKKRPHTAFSVLLSSTFIREFNLVLYAYQIV